MIASTCSLMGAGTGRWGRGTRPDWKAGAGRGAWLGQWKNRSVPLAAPLPPTLRVDDLSRDAGEVVLSVSGGGNADDRAALGVGVHRRGKVLEYAERHDIGPPIVLRMPLHADSEARHCPGSGGQHVNGLDGAVRRHAFHPHARRQLVDALVMQRIHLDLGGAGQPVQPAAWGNPDAMRLA